MGNKKFIIIAVVALLVAWFIIGTLRGPAPAPQTREPRLMNVRIERTINVPTMATVVIFGEARANDRFEIKSRLAGTLERRPKAKGAPVKKGEVVARMGIEDRDANFKRAEVEYETAKKLFAEGLISRLEHITAKANYERARHDIEHTIIRAPFDGVVGPIHFSEGAYVPANTEIGLVLNLNTIKVIAEVPERHIASLKLGAIATIEIPGRKPFTAPIVYIAPTANPATRTFPIELAVKNPGGIQDGMTAEIKLPLGTVEASLIPNTSSLTFDEEGNVGLKVVVENDLVKFYPVELVKEDEDGLWITGLPSPAYVITHGQEFVRQGERVATKRD
ncbi:MAG: efflux RND transporter periplasmic adaptor subunit [Alphaproteobacteria bacterium]|nr:efflux RND transporter periplasmic adaptor subunit [Alphaproteobacteria bacterium]